MLAKFKEKQKTNFAKAKGAKREINLKTGNIDYHPETEVSTWMSAVLCFGAIMKVKII